MVTFSGNYGFLPPSHTHEIVTHILKVVSLSLDEFFTFGETLDKSKFTSRAISENPFVISELVDPVKILVRNLAEAFNFPEYPGFTEIGFTTIGFNFNQYTLSRVVIKAKTLTESVTFTGTAAISRIRPRSLAESFTLGESLTRVLTKVRSRAESFTLGETLTRATVKLRSFISAESFTMTDSAFAAKQKSKSLSETVTFGETLNRLSLKARALAESFTTGSSVARATIKARAPGFPETFTIGEALTKIKTSTKSIAQSFAFGETLTRSLSKFRSIAQSFTITDAVTKGQFKAIFINEIPIAFAGIPTFVKKSVRNLAESVTFGESLTRMTIKARSIAQSFSIGEALTKSAINIRSVAESFTIGDALTIIRTKTRALAEAITFSDSVTRTRQFVKTLAESFSITDSRTIAKIKGRLVNESFTISEFLSLTRLISGAPRWIISGQSSDFLDSIENLVKTYVNSNWTLATPALGTNTASQAQIDKFAYDGFRTYYIKVREIASDVQTRRIRFNTYEFETPIEFDLFSRLLSKGEAFTELNDMINELMRIFGTFQHEAMFGIQGVTFERISPIEREKSAAQTVWARRFKIVLHYYKTSTIG